MATIFKVQPQRVAVGTFRSPNGQEVPVYMTVPWYRAFEQLAKVVETSNGGGNGGGQSDALSMDAAPPYQYGAVVFASGDQSVRRLPAGSAGQVLFYRGAGLAPDWDDLPVVEPSLPLSSLLCDDEGRLLLDGTGVILTDA